LFVAERFHYANTFDELCALALSHGEQARALGTGSVSQTASACSICALAGDRDSAERLLQELMATIDQEYVRYMFLAQASVSLGKDQQALEYLEKAYDQRDPLLVFLKADPRFERLSQFGRFRKLLHRIGLTKRTRHSSNESIKI
jgi:hypothetical protein